MSAVMVMLGLVLCGACLLVACIRGERRREERELKQRIQNTIALASARHASTKVVQ